MQSLVGFPAVWMACGNSHSVVIGANGGVMAFGLNTHGQVTRCLVLVFFWFGSVWFGLAWFGWIWFGLAWFTLVWLGFFLFRFVSFRFVSFRLFRFISFGFKCHLVSLRSFRSVLRSIRSISLRFASSHSFGLRSVLACFSLGQVRLYSRFSLFCSFLFRARAMHHKTGQQYTTLTAM